MQAHWQSVMREFVALVHTPAPHPHQGLDWVHRMS
jgi:hypothetical protein